jgi:Thioredoxin
LVVIKYYSVSCKACQTLAPKFRKLVRDIESLDRSIIFAEMALTRNKNFLQETLKLQALPSIQIYTGEMLLDSFSCPPEKAAKLLQAMKYWILQGINSNSKGIHFPLHWDSLSPPSSFWEREKIMSSRGNAEFFESEVSGDDVSSQIQQVDDSVAPRNNVIASPGASEFVSITSDADIPLQLSDLFLLDDDEDEPT